MLASLTPRQRIKLAALVLALAAGAVAFWRVRAFPANTTPEGAYLRIAEALGRGDAAACFPYLEEDAQHAVFTIHGYAREASARIGAAYPEPERSAALARYQPIAAAPDATALWVELARERGYVARLRRDLSGVAAVEIAGERATVVTARGTRYPFRRRPNGIWGLTIFSAELVSEAERFARDWDVIQRAAADYELEK